MEWMIVKGKEGRGDGKGLVYITYWVIQTGLKKMEDKYVKDDIGETQDNFFYFLV